MNSSKFLKLLRQLSFLKKKLLEMSLWIKEKLK